MGDQAEYQGGEGDTHGVPIIGPALAVKKSILILGNPLPEMEEWLSPEFILVHPVQESMCNVTEEEATRIEGIAVSSHVPVTAELMETLPKLRIISCCSVGYDYVDAAWAGKHGIVVTNTPSVLTEEVADTALGLLLCTVRRFPQAERFLREGKWLQGNFPLSKGTLRESSAGIIGMGRIGQAIARRLNAFGVPVVYHNPSPKKDLPYRYYNDLATMAGDVDILINCAPGGDATRNIISANVIKALGPEGTLINIGRGSSVDQDALIAALERGELRAAGLDVFRDEPRVPERLLALDNVVPFPHLGSATEYTRRAMFRLAADNLLAWSSGKPPLTPVAETPWLQRPL